MAEDECSTVAEGLVASRRNARRRFGELQGVVCLEDEANQVPQRLSPSASFFHSDVCDLIAQAETCDVQVDNAHGRSFRISLQSSDKGSFHGGNRAHRRNGTMQGFGQTSDCRSGHVPKQNTSMIPPRMPIRRATNESDDDEQKRDQKDDAEKYYGDCVPSQPMRRPTNEGEDGSDESSSVASSRKRSSQHDRLGDGCRRDLEIMPLEERSSRQVWLHIEAITEKPSSNKPVRRLGIGNWNRSISIAPEEKYFKLVDSEIRFPFNFQQHDVSDISLEAMLIAPRIPTRKPSPPMGETEARESLNNSSQDKSSICSSQESVLSGCGVSSTSSSAAHLQPSLPLHIMPTRIA